MTVQIKGSLCGIIAAITYGLNPLGALNLYSDGINVDSVLFYRYGLAVLVLAAIMLLQKASFRISRRDLAICAFLGCTFAVSSTAFFKSFYYLDVSVACTLIFAYPIMVAIIMALFFKERITVVVCLSIAIAIGGITLLYYDDAGVAISTLGVLIIMGSALTYAVYIVVVNKSGIHLPPVTLTLFVMLFATLTIIMHSFTATEYQLQMLTSVRQWGWVLMLALLPTVICLILMVVAIESIGSTPTAIMGALEPVTAVTIGVLVFNESFTLRIAMGMLLILLAVFLIIVEKPLAYRLEKNRLHKREWQR